MSGKRAGEAGFTLVELTVTVVIIGIVTVSFFGLFISLVHSTIVAKRRAVALTLATNQMEYLKSLPYDNLAVQGGSIYATTLLPATKNQTLNGVKYTVTTSIGYVDDAYDGCGSYDTQADKQTYCRNYPPPSGAPATDTNPADYKIAHVDVVDTTGAHLASVDTEIAARVSETASTTGALFVHVVDSSGTPVSGATVNVVNTTITPNANVSDSTDGNGVAIFYGLPPDSGTDYIITASMSNYSTLFTMSASGSLQPTYASQKILSQQSSGVTLTIAPQGSNSLVLETTDTNGAPLGSVKVYVKGGYKKYTSATDYGYYYDNTSPSDLRPITDATTGLATVSNLAPVGSYLFCNSDATSAASSPSSTTNCAAGATKYYLAAAVPYGGQNSLMPVTIPTYTASNPPGTTFDDGHGNAYLQKVRLILTSNTSFPRVYSLNPYSVSLGSGANLSSFLLTVNGYNLGSATAKLVQGGSTYNAISGSCNNTMTQLKCSYNLTGITTGTAQLVVTNSAGTLTLPVSPLGGFNVTP